MFTDWLNDLIDSVFAPACVSDPCSSGFIDNFANDSYTSGIDDAWGTQNMYQPAAEAFSNDPFSTVDTFRGFSDSL